MEVQVTTNSEAESRVSASPDRLAPKKDNPVHRMHRDCGRDWGASTAQEYVADSPTGFCPTKRDEEFGLRWVGFRFGSLES